MRAIITGHSRGLGAALAEALLVRGIAVFGLARAPNAGLRERFPQLFGEACIDLANDAALQAQLCSEHIVEFLAGSGPRLLINNAGVLQPMGPPGVQGAAAIQRAVAVNIAAPLALSDAFVAATEKSEDRRILHVSSGAAANPYPGWSIYCASKAALDQHARAVHTDRLPRLRIASVAPGVIDTDMQAEIRACDSTLFPLRSKFKDLKDNGLLLAPEDCALRLIDHLLSRTFGESVVTDLRAL